MNNIIQIEINTVEALGHTECGEEGIPKEAEVGFKLRSEQHSGARVKRYGKKALQAE